MARAAAARGHVPSPRAASPPGSGAQGSRRAAWGDRPSGLADLVVGLDVLAEHGVDAPPRVVEDVQRAPDLVLAAGLDDLHDRDLQLGDPVAQPPGGSVGGLADLLPRGPDVASPLGLGGAFRRQGEPALAVDLLRRDHTLVLQELEHRGDRAGAGAPDATAAGLGLLDHLVAV